jgi:predicted dehydrogenase
MSIRVGAIGAGYWGPNLIRNLFQTPMADLKVVCDLDSDRLNYVGRLYPTISCTSDYRELIEREDVDAVIVATPAQTHYEMTKAVLAAGKHALVEKPLTLKSSESEELIDLAERHSRILMVGHTFMYNPAVRAMKQLINSGEIGDIYYIYSNRVNLGRVRKDINALWNIAPHDISILLYLLEEMPLRVSAQGQTFLQDGIEDVVFATYTFRDNVMANVQVSWLDPSKVRRTTVVGSKKMIIYDDVASEGKLKIYDKGALKVGNGSVFGEFQIKLHSGDIHIPRIDLSEPLRNEINHFLECVQSGQTPETDGRNGLQVVRILEATQESLKLDGRPVEIPDG